MATYALTGGATGIGAAVKQSLQQQGHRLIVVDIKDADIIADLGSAEGRQQAVEGIKAAAGGQLDGLVTCAGLGGHIPDKALIASVNYFGSVALIEQLKPLLAAGRGSVVLIASNSAPQSQREDFVSALLDGDEQRAREIATEIDPHQVYSGSKKAVSLWMRRETPAYAGLGIRLNAVAPGYTRTPLTEANEEDPRFQQAIRDFVSSIPLGRPGLPEDIAAAVTFLLSAEAGFIAGSLLYVDGGHDALFRPQQF